MRPGFWQIIIVVVLVLIVFGGAKKIPEIMRSMGEGIRGFKKAYNEEDEPKKKDDDPEKIADASSGNGGESKDA